MLLKAFEPQQHLLNLHCQRFSEQIYLRIEFIKNFSQDTLDYGVFNVLFYGMFRERRDDKGQEWDI